MREHRVGAYGVLGGVVLWGEVVVDVAEGIRGRSRNSANRGKIRAFKGSIVALLYYQITFWYRDESVRGE